MATPTLGIDIAKLKLNECLLRQGGAPRHKVFPDRADGFAQLAGWLTRQGAPRTHACMEATGAYGEALALHPHAAGHRVSVINPAAVKAFAQSRLSRTKTDKVDAELIARLFTVPLEGLRLPEYSLQRAWCVQD
jgi:transposase